MPSSISSSSAAAASARVRIRPVKRAILMFAALLVLQLGAAELLTRLGLRRISRIEQRTLSDRTAALSIRQSVHGAGPVAVLMVGNSLLLKAVDFPALQKQLPARIRPVRLVVEQTAYFDWYYGLRELFREGSHPDAVVICLDVANFIASGSDLPDYVARTMLGTADILPYAHDLHLDHTQISTLLFSHYSSFFAARAHLRNFFLNIACPACTQLIHGLIYGSPGFPPDDVVRHVTEGRLRALNALCGDNRTRLVVLIRPSRRKLNLLTAAAARQAGIELLMPAMPGEFPAPLFSDGFHLSPDGATVFTTLLASDMAAHFGGTRATPASMR